MVGRGLEEAVGRMVTSPMALPTSDIVESILDERQAVGMDVAFRR